jgi:GST-like protein
LIYLAEKSGKFLPVEMRKRFDVLQWLMWQMGGLEPMARQNHHFAGYAPERIKYAIDRYINETNRLYGVLNKRLSDREFIIGEYSIADMACYPCTENLNPNVLTMKSAQYGARIYDAGSLNLARDRRIFVQ